MLLLKQKKSNCYVLGEFEIVGFSHVLWTLEAAAISLPSMVTFLAL